MSTFVGRKETIIPHTALARKLIQITEVDRDGNLRILDEIDPLGLRYSAAKAAVKSLGVLFAVILDNPVQ
jgi:hypothetical protein